jgi:hypothetical protein
MSYKNKTYLIFDGDNDMWAYAYMKGWKENDHIDFNFYDAHDIRPLTDRASEETVKKHLRERMSNAKQVIVLVGEHTKNLYKFVRWEIDLAIADDLPTIVVNLNGKRAHDPDRCPPILRNVYAVHVPFKMKIIKYALDNFPDQHAGRARSAVGPLQYNESVYARLDLQ